MNGTELLKKTVKQYVGSSITEDEYFQIVRSIHKDFNEVYKAYQAKESSFIAKGSGVKVDIEFNRENNAVGIKMQEKEFTLTELEFLKLLNLIEICYGSVLPLGSVVKLNLDKVPQELRKLYGAITENSMFMISGRKIPVSSSTDEYYIDYVVRMFPFGESEYMQPFFISKTMIESVEFEGMSNELEDKFVDAVLREEIVYKNRRSTIFLLDEEAKQLEQEIQALYVASEGATVDGDGYINSGTA